MNFLSVHSSVRINSIDYNIFIKRLRLLRYSGCTAGFGLAKIQKVVFAFINWWFGYTVGVKSQISLPHLRWETKVGCKSDCCFVSKRGLAR